MRAGEVAIPCGRLSVGAHWRAARRWAATAEGRRFLLVLGAALGVRLAIAPIRGFDHDLQAYATWGESLDHFGWHVYASNHDVSYPPLTVYFFGFMSGVALIWHGLMGARLDLTVRDSSALMAFMRLPFILSDLLTIGLLYALARRVVSARVALLAAAVYAFLPAILLDGVLWPQTDGVMTLGILIIAVLALRGRAGGAGAVLAATILIKPQPLIFVPQLLVYMWRWHGGQAAARYFAAHPGYSVAISASNVTLLLCGLVMMWQGSTRRAATTVPFGTLGRSDAENAPLSVMQREVEHAAERAL